MLSQFLEHSLFARTLLGWVSLGVVQAVAVATIIRFERETR